MPHGLPIIVINPLPGQEEENAEFLEKNDVAIWIHNSNDVKNVLENLFNSPEKMQKMKINARLLAKKNSCKEICDICLQEQKRILITFKLFRILTYTPSNTYTVVGGYYMGCLSDLSGYELVSLAALLAAYLSQGLTSSEINTLGSFFSALGDNLNIIGGAMYEN